MLEVFTLCSIYCSIILIGIGDATMIGPGKWHMLKMEKSGASTDEVELNLSQRKLNRTHDCFQGSLVFHYELGREYGAKIDVCKFVDGGCKQYQVLSDESFQNMVESYVKNNFETMLGMAGLDDPSFPIPPGEYHIKDYIFNYDELPEEGPYGRYEAKACCMKGAAETGCIIITVEFKETADDDDDEED